MDIAQIKDWLIVIQLAGTALLFVLLLYARSVFVTRSEYQKFSADVGTRLTNQSERLTSTDNRIQLLDQRQSTMPTERSLFDLQKELTIVSGQLGITNERLNGLEALQDTIRHQVTVMDEFIRNQS